LVRNIESPLAEEELIKIRIETRDGLAILNVNVAHRDTAGQAKIARSVAGRKAA